MRQKPSVILSTVARVTGSQLEIKRLSYSIILPVWDVNSSFLNRLVVLRTSFIFPTTPCADTINKGAIIIGTCIL